jgi:hypothetical protein
MNHQAMIEHDSMRLYRNRDYVQHFLDLRVFDLLNDATDGLHLMTTGCLDALEHMPTGSMCSSSYGPFIMDVGRGSTPELRKWQQEMSKKLIAQLRAEEGSRA